MIPDSTINNSYSEEENQDNDVDHGFDLQQHIAQLLDCQVQWGTSLKQPT